MLQGGNAGRWKAVVSHQSIVSVCVCLRVHKQHSASLPVFLLSLMFFFYFTRNSEAKLLAAKWPAAVRKLALIGLQVQFVSLY